MSGKNSADIAWSWTRSTFATPKEHIDTFVIISGDSDFSPLVSKLRENAKTVIGVGVKNSTSDLLMNNCDEFIYYDDLARAIAAPTPRRKPPAPKKPAVATEKPAVEKPAVAAKAPAAKPASAEDNAALEAKEAEAIDMVVKLAEELIAERGGQVWSSMVKQTLKRRKPGFNESFYGFRSFSEVTGGSRRPGPAGTGTGRPLRRLHCPDSALRGLIGLLSGRLRVLAVAKCCEFSRNAVAQAQRGRRKRRPPAPDDADTARHLRPGEPAIHQVGGVHRSQRQCRDRRDPDARRQKPQHGAEMLYLGIASRYGARRREAGGRYRYPVPARYSGAHALRTNPAVYHRPADGPAGRAST